MTTANFSLDASSLGLLAKKTNPDNESVAYAYDEHDCNRRHQGSPNDETQTPLTGGASMFLALMFVEPAVPNFDVTYRGQLISSLPCNHGVSVSDVRASPAADVVFHDTYAELTFASVYDEERTLFVYVDGLKVALITAKGPVRMLVPLGQRANHKIVTGNTNVAGGLHSAWAVCS